MEKPVDKPKQPATCCASHRKPAARYVTTPALTESGSPIWHSCGGHLWHTSKPVEPGDQKPDGSVKYRYCTSCTLYVIWSE